MGTKILYADNQILCRELNFVYPDTNVIYAYVKILSSRGKKHLGVKKNYMRQRKIIYDILFSLYKSQNVLYMYGNNICANGQP